MHPCLEDMSTYASVVTIQASYGVLAVFLENENSERNLLPLAVISYGLGASVLCPFAFFLEKGKRSKMSLSLLAQVLLISLSGMEKVDIRSAHSQSKIVGTVICVMGAMVMSLITGPTLIELNRLSIPHSQTSPVNVILGFLQGNSAKSIRGCIYLFAAVMCHSYSMILQAKALKKYPAPFSLTTMAVLLGSMEIAIYVMIQDKGIDRESWVVDWNGVVIIIYGTLTCHGFIYALQYWCVQKRGPIFVAIFKPISAVCSAILSFLFLGDSIHLGSAIGTMMIFGGLYAVLWGKSKDNISDKRDQPNTAEIEEGSQVRKPPALLMTNDCQSHFGFSWF